MNGVKKLACGVVLSAALGAASAWATTIDPSNYNYSMTIAPASGQVTSTLTNFPVLVRLSSARQSGFNPADCGANGADLRFALADGTLLAHEIDTWSLSGESLVWVNVPSLSSSTEIVAYWGVIGSSSAPAVNAADTWPDFVGVWHLGEGAAIVRDSSGNGYDATNIAAVVAGKNPMVGGCVSCSNLFVTGVFDFTDTNAAKPLVDRSKLTVTAWAAIDNFDKRENPPDTYGNARNARVDIANKLSGWKDGNGGFSVRFFEDNGYKNTSPAPFFGFVSNSGTGSGDIDNWNTITTSSGGNWRYFTYTMNGTAAVKYVNAAVLESATRSHGILGPDVTVPLMFGASDMHGGNGNVNTGLVVARMDELRIRNGAASAAWVSADYAQQNSDTFLDYSIVKSVFAISPIAAQLTTSAAELEAGIEPAVTISNIVDGVELVQSTHYTVAYSNNHAAGVAMVTATGIGAYAGKTSFATFVIHATKTVDDNYPLEDDEDWSMFETVTVASGKTINLHGHNLTVRAIGGTCTVTDTDGGGELRFDVPSGSSFTISSTLALTGRLKLVKKGGGLLVCGRDQSYTGGTDILAGILRTTIPPSGGCLGAASQNAHASVYLGPNAILDPGGKPGWGYNDLTIAGGMVSNTVAGGNMDYGFFNANATVVSNFTFATTENYAWTIAGLGGHTVTVDIAPAKMLYVSSSANTPPGTGRLNVVRGGNVTTFSNKTADFRTVDFDAFSAAPYLQGPMSVHDYNATYQYNYGNGSAALNVYGTFTPVSDYFYGPTMQDGSTIDLSAKTGVWSVTSSLTDGGNATTTFAAGANVWIRLGERELSPGDKIVSWTTQPDATFSCMEWSLESRSDGLYTVAKDPVEGFFSISGGRAKINDLGDHFALVFSNDVSTTITLTALKPCTLMRSLVVGGGGAGGNTMGGGGGGGQVVASDDLHIVSTNDVITLTVGDGGAKGTGYYAGLQGGTSSLTLPDGTTINAYGGGGGGGYSAKEPTASAAGEIGSGGGNGFDRTTEPTKGTHYNYGNPGGLGQGGGGGAGTAGENAGLHAESVLYDDETAYRTQAGYGGEGVTNDISGVAEVYGSGGGGGGGQNCWSQIHAPGGTHAGAGAVRTDKTGGGDGVKEALPADEGFGAGGGGGSFSQSGGASSGGAASKGGCGTVILRFSKTDLSTLLFEVDPIPDQYFTGSAQTPAVVVRHVIGGTVVDPANYDVTYADNVNPGTARVTVAGKGAYDGIRAFGSFVISSMVSYEYPAYDDLSVRRTNVDDRIVYIFTNTTDVFTFRALVNLTLADALVVGGGGGGGNSVGGAGGGGGVTQLGGSRMLFSGQSLTINVGAGGSNDDGAAGFRSGTQGGTSTVVFPNASPLVAYGGGGGGGFQKSPTAVTDGHVASGGGSSGGASPGTDGANYNSTYGHVGGTSSFNLGGGGGGAGTAASGGGGGEGVANGITGVNVVYGSGGGGGARNSGTPGAGGTNAGNGTNGNATVPASNGVDGTGSGGGGGGYTGNPNGGFGGCGTIILAFEEGVTIGQPTVESLTVAYLGDTTQPRVSAAFGNSKPGGIYSATVKMSFYLGDGTLLETNMYYGVADGDAIEWNVPVCVQPGAEVYATVLVTSTGAVDVTSREDSTATGSISPYYGRGGGTGVIHVRPGATGRGDGSDWFHAYPDFRAALAEISAERPELWFAGDEGETAVPNTISPAVPVVIRGGFAGTEDSAAARAPGALSTIDKNGKFDCLTFNNSQPVTLDGFWLKRGQSHNLNKSGAGDITVTNCVSSDVSGITSGHGGYLVGSSTAVARFANVRFSNLFGGGQTGGNKGTAFYLETFSRVYIDDCTFSTNGCGFNIGFGNSMYDQDGAALFAKNAPITVRGTRFLANRSQVLNTSGERGGVVRVTGACGATAFTNCLFVGNEVVHAYGNIADYKSDIGGMLAASPSSGTVDIVNCTFAMGLATITCGPAAVAARAGTVNVVNSIFYGNTNCAWNTAGSDIHVAAGATANVSYCLFEDDSAGRIVCAEGGTANLATSTFVYGNPLFVTDSAPSSFIKAAKLASTGDSILLDQNKIGELTAFNPHLRGGLGYFDEATRALVKDYARGEKSPGIDKGNPNSDYRKEPAGYNGRRVNLGYYGNTPWATMTQPVGSVYYLR